MLTSASDYCCVKYGRVWFFSDNYIPVQGQNLRFGKRRPVIENPYSGIFSIMYFQTSQHFCNEKMLISNEKIKRDWFHHVCNKVAVQKNIF